VIVGRIETKMSEFDPEKDMRILGRAFSKRFLISIFLFCFVSIFLAQNIIFIKLDSHSMSSDNHFYRSLLYYDRIFLNYNSNFAQIPYPPLFFLLAQPFYGIMGVSMESARLGVSMMSIIFLLAMFGIGYELGGNYAGAAVMALAASSPFVLEVSRQYAPEFPQTAMTALCFYILLKSDGFKNRLYSILLGVVLTISFLFKWSTAFFMFLPLLWFLVPNIINSKRAFKTFLLFLIPVGIMAGGTAWFFNNIGISSLAASQNLFFYFPILVALPCLLFAILIWYLDRRYSKEDNYKGSGTYGVVNFAHFFLIFILLTGPWFYWAASSLKVKFIIDINDPANSAENLGITIYALKNMFAFAPILLMVGMGFIFSSRKYIYRRLIVPITIIVATLILFNFASWGYRYLLSLVIFMAVLGGFWVGLTGRMRPVLASILVIFSMVSMFGWTIFPGYGDENEMNMFFPQTASPYSTSFNMNEAINWITPGEPGKWKNIVLYEKRLMPFDSEHLQEKAYLGGKRLNPLYGHCEGVGDVGFESQIPEATSGSPLLSGNEIDDRLVKKLKNARESLTLHIHNGLSPETRKMIDEYSEGSSLTEKLRTSLIRDLNRIITGPAIYNEEWFREFKLSPETQKLARQQPWGVNLERLNRLLLQEAFDGAIGASSHTLRWNDLNSIDDIIITHKTGSSIDNIIKITIELFPDVSYERRTFDVGEGCSITVIKLDRMRKNQI